MASRHALALEVFEVALLSEPVLRLILIFLTGVAAFTHRLLDCVAQVANRGAHKELLLARLALPLVLLMFCIRCFLNSVEVRTIEEDLHLLGGALFYAVLCASLRVSA